MNNKKIINDPVYGFINIPSENISTIIQHPYFQKMKRIKQLGLIDFVYPGAHHSRFHHALGAMHLMTKTLDSLRNKGIEINDKEYEATLFAILLHDIGHGPFSHSFDGFWVKDTSHEDISLMVMEYLNKQFDGLLDLAIQIFKGEYVKKFLSELISSQLDIDRLDYLKRDCFFTGVIEGSIGSERIIKMLNVVNNHLVIEEKGIYSIENFLSARRMMYWQVYYHKTAICAEKMMFHLIKRVKHLVNSSKNQSIILTPALEYFMINDLDKKLLKKNKNILVDFMKLDDYDIWGSMKFWINHNDKVIQTLTNRLFNRNLFKVKVANTPFDDTVIMELKNKTKSLFSLNDDEVNYFIYNTQVSNVAYFTKSNNINILTKNNETIDVSLATDLPNILAISKYVNKYYLCYPKEINES